MKYTKERLQTYLVSIEVSLNGYIYYHTYLLQARDKASAEITIDRFIYTKYGSSYDIEYSLCSICEIDHTDVSILEKYIEYLAYETNWS